LTKPKTPGLYAKARERGSALYYAGKPTFDEILAEIRKWIEKLRAAETLSTQLSSSRFGPTVAATKVQQDGLIC